ncbi:uncharacterized protein LY79DRAFT_275696 [Colletotrichum navitas]|uniref:Uncharacterized protein n=1 Tax=Colletotrichum navitas TaxID=681940 RepID=A0AAD8V1B7_9PEZI|nr:uncharacterized protein LY79DRAFT_275696 [Colletotrichum navitas]KAK1585141.1 hypothetical protein LY79DRAFT_275696 [Colletotrichum navitas]
MEKYTMGLRISLISRFAPCSMPSSLLRCKYGMALTTMAPLVFARAALALYEDGLDELGMCRGTNHLGLCFLSFLEALEGWIPNAHPSCTRSPWGSGRRRRRKFGSSGGATCLSAR